jgi:heterodisulfide reductase subunit A
MSVETTPQVGVFVCECGDQISGTLDSEALRRAAAGLPGVVYATCEAYPCSKDGQIRIQQAITERKLDRVLIAGCTPRLVRHLFENTLQAASLDRSYLDVRDIREQCAYVHSGYPDAAQQKAANLIEMGVERLAAITPPRVYSGQVINSALIIGSGLSGLTTAISLADSGIDVTLLERSSTLGGELQILQDQAQDLIARNIEAVLGHPRIHIMLNANITEVIRQPGNYQVSVTERDKTLELRVGAIIVASGAQPKPLVSDRWYDRSRVKTQVEYSLELGLAVEAGNGLALQDIVLILYTDEADSGHFSQLNCMAILHQAIRTKQLNPEANVLILFREIKVGSIADRGTDDFLKAKDLGVTFFRYQEGHPPVIGDTNVDVYDELTGEAVQIPFDRVVIALPLEPTDNAKTLASILRLPQDEAGFIQEPHLRLRPGRHVDDGIYLVGGAHEPADTAEALFHAYITSARALRFLKQGTICVETPIAEIEADYCTGCGNCVQVCPMSAINLEKRDGVLSLSEVNVLRCIGCGNCVVVCPVKAITLPGWNDAAILAQISAALKLSRTPGEQDEDTEPGPRVVELACEWSAYAAADMAGVRRIDYPPEARIIRMNCSARFDPNLILWAFLNGADGVFLGACYPGECHYGTGNLYAKERIEVLKKQLAERGVDPNRLHLEFLSGDDGDKFAQSIFDFIQTVKSTNRQAV